MYAVRMCSSTELVGMNKTQEVSSGHDCKCKSVGHTQGFQMLSVLQCRSCVVCVLGSSPGHPMLLEVWQSLLPTQTIGGFLHWSQTSLSSPSVKCRLYFVNPCRGNWQKVILWFRWHCRDCCRDHFSCDPWDPRATTLSLPHSTK